MPRLSQNDTFFQNYHRFYMLFRIFCLAATEAAEDLEGRQEAADARFEAAETRTEEAEARTQEASSKTELEKLRAMRETALQSLKDVTDAQWRESFQAILQGGHEFINLSTIEQTQFQSIEHFLHALKTSFFQLIEDVLRGTTERDLEEALSYRRWLRWNEAYIDEELTWLSAIHQKFTINPHDQNIFGSEINALKRQVSTALQEHANIQTLYTDLTHFANRAKRSKNQRVIHHARERLRSLISEIIRVEAYGWFEQHKETINLLYVELSPEQQTIIAVWQQLQQSIKDDIALRENTAEQLRTENIRRTAMAQRQTWEHARDFIRDQATDNRFIRFWKNLWRAVKNPRATGRALWAYMKEHPLRTASFFTGLAIAIGLCVFIPFVAPVLIAALPEIAAGVVSTVVATVAIGAAAASVGTIANAADLLATAGQTIADGDDAHINGLQEEVRQAEQRAQEAEAKARQAEEKAERAEREAEAAKSRNDANRVVLERQALRDRIKADQERAQANLAKLQALAAQERLAERTSIQQQARAAELSHSDSQVQIVQQLAQASLYNDMATTLETTELDATSRRQVLQQEEIELTAHIAHHRPEAEAFSEQDQQSAAALVARAGAAAQRDSNESLEDELVIIDRNPTPL